jgi:hypothetical protein
LPEKTYTYVGFVIVGGAGKYTDPVSFTTLPEPVVKVPTVELLRVTGVTPTSAKVAIKVVDNGGANITSLGVAISMGLIESGKAPSFYKTFAAAVQQSGELVINLTGLASDTAFHVAAFAINSKGHAYSNQIPFSTPEGVQLPSVELLPFFDSASTPTSVSVDARITSDGGGALLRAGAVWSAVPMDLEGSPEGLDDVQGVLENPAILQLYPGLQNFNIRINNLDPESHYYYGLFVQNEAGYGWTQLEEFITPVGALNETTVTCVDTAGKNSITLQATVNSTFGIREVGYMHGTSLNNLTKVKTGTSSPVTVTYTNYTIGTYYIRAYVITSDGKTTVSDTFVLRVGSPIDGTLKFNPPADTKIKNYEFKFDGVVRRWRRNKENGWERIHNSQTAADTSQQQKAKQAAPPPAEAPGQTSDQIIATLSARVAELEKRVGFTGINYLTAHFSRTDHIEGVDGSSAKLVIALGESFKFSHLNNLSEPLFLTTLDESLYLEDLILEVDSINNTVSYEYNISTQGEEITTALARVVAGSSFVVYSYSMGDLRKMNMPLATFIADQDIIMMDMGRGYEGNLSAVFSALRNRVEQSVISGSGAPATAPAFRGQMYYDTGGQIWYIAEGNTVVGDWVNI